MNWKVRVSGHGTIVAVTREDIENSEEVENTETDTHAGVIIDRDKDGVICGVGFTADEPILLKLGDG